jgi:uncharacterized protein (DUF433 family)
LEKGEAKGEYKKAISIALKMVKKGMSIEDIIEITGLTREQIEEILKQEKL